MLISLQQLIDEDLSAICADLTEEFNRMSGGRLLITGGGGFLGYYLVQSVLHWNRKCAAGAAPIDVTVYDNYLLGVPNWLEALSSDPHLSLMRQDMIQPLPHDLGHFDWIVHAAGIASPSVYRAQPLKCIDANINGLRNLLDYSAAQADRQPVKGMLFFSSSEIYGDPVPASIPTPETYRGNVSCTGPRACYDEAKRFGETLCVTYAHQKNIPVKIARPFNNYGPGLKISDGRVIADFARDILDGRDIVMLSDGKPTRTFCYATDAITGYYKVLVRGGSGEPYNIGIESPEISIAQLAQHAVDAAAGLFGYRGKVRLGKPSEADYLVDNPNRRCPAIDKARNHLGFAPRVLIGDGIRRALIWYHHNQLAVAA